MSTDSQIERIGSNHRMSQVVRSGDTVWLAGQIPDDVKAGVKAQTAEVLERIDRILQSLGGSKSDLVSVQIWLNDLADIQQMNLAWDDWVDPENPPARATCGAALVSAGRGVRIEVIATAVIAPPTR